VKRRQIQIFTMSFLDCITAGFGAVILLYNAEKGTVVLTRQFRLVAHVNGHDEDLIEACAGLLDERDPETAIRHEAEEETGFRVGEVTKIWVVFMSPGSVTERVHFFAAPYDATTRRSAGGGLADEGEHIQLVELDIDEAVASIGTDIVDGKTIMLLQWAVLSGPFAR